QSAQAAEAGSSNARVIHPFCHLRLNAFRSDSCASRDALRSIAPFVRARRLELKLTQQECRKALGISKHTLENWENGRTTPDRKRIGRLGQFLGFYPSQEPTAAKH